MYLLWGNAFHTVYLQLRDASCINHGMDYADKIGYDSAMNVIQ